ncbi:MAG TPA: hypothetical protein VHJ78_11265 [Actinomycetota bacterium]|nr:hypothetical protein [Actinomycetota bacterium]
MSQAPEYGTGSETLHGSSMDSVEDAIRNALSSSPSQSNQRRMAVSLEVEEGGVVGRLQYHVTLNPQPLPPGPERAEQSTLNPQPLPPSPEDAIGTLPS